MKPLYARLQEARKLSGMPWEVLERDYILSWVLAGIAEVPSLRETLVFKGGTALKKCYFGDYRFSEDLDFSGLQGSPTGEAMERAARGACAAAAALLEPYGPVEFSCRRYTERDPHPGAQEAFTVRARLPWQRGTQTRVTMEVTLDEPVHRRKVIHAYGEPMDGEVLVYALEEIVAEKLRAILQHAQKLEERGWSRSRARDYYDLWRVLGAFGGQMDLTGFASFLKAKCAVRQVAFDGPEDFLLRRMLAHVERTWDEWLGPLVPGLPDVRTVMRGLRPEVAALLEGGRLLAGPSAQVLDPGQVAPGCCQQGACPHGTIDDG